MPCANRVPGQSFSNSSLVALFHLAKIEGPLPLRKLEGVGSPGEVERWASSCIYLWWLMSRNAVVLGIRVAEVGQRPQVLAALC